MSQCDYLKYKRVSTILKLDSTKPPVLESQNYVNYKQFTLENTIPNTSILYNRITPTMNRLVFNMDKPIMDPENINCPKFIVCAGTHARPNRVLNNRIIINNGITDDIPYTIEIPYTTPLPKTIKQKKLVINTETKCKCPESYTSTPITDVVEDFLG